jgi:hypothetical protein
MSPSQKTTKNRIVQIHDMSPFFVSKMIFNSVWVVPRARRRTTRARRSPARPTTQDPPPESSVSSLTLLPGPSLGHAVQTTTGG